MEIYVIVKKNIKNGNVLIEGAFTTREKAEMYIKLNSICVEFWEYEVHKTILK